MNRADVNAIQKRIISVVYPNVCPFCGKVTAWNEYWCVSCYEYLPYVKDELVPIENISRFYACCYYLHRVRKAVHMLKFSAKIYPAEAFARMMEKMLADELKTADILVPVPSGALSVINRGFAPADKIANIISLNSGVPLVKAIKARRDKLDQKELSIRKRAENAKNSFRPAKNIDVKGKRIILIDDVCTTGSTLSACAEILLNAGAKDVAAAVFAKTKNYSHKEQPQAAQKNAVKKERLIFSEN